MQTSAFFLLAGLLLLLIPTGCASTQISRRIDEKFPSFARLAPAQQANIRQGVIELGYTADMIYMALGHPAKTTLRHTSDGPVGIWIYNRLSPVDPQVHALPSPPVGTNTTTRPGAVRPLRPGSAVGPWQTMEPIELAAETLYVLFYRGRVIEIKLAAHEG